MAILCLGQLKVGVKASLIGHGKAVVTSKPTQPATSEPSTKSSNIVEQCNRSHNDFLAKVKTCPSSMWDEYCRDWCKTRGDTR